MNRTEIRQILEEAERQRRRTSRRGFRGVMKNLYGGFGELWSIISEVFSGGSSVGPEDIKRAYETLDTSGFDIERGVDVHDSSLRIPSVGVVPRVGGDRDKRKIQLATSGDRHLPLISAPHIEDRGQYDIFANWVETPQSSNVWGIGYDTQRQILYVMYKAGNKTTSYSDRTNGCTGKDYRLGHRPHVKGPVYAYGSRKRPVPKSVYDGLLSATSKGGFIWDRLRVCGSHWQHQFPYILVSPSLAYDKVYTPRKAARNGFRVRTVPTIGFGKRPVFRSDLPPTA